MSQLSLVFFTVLAQSAVGLFVFLGLVQMLARPHEKAMTRAFLAVFALLGLGAISSITHLGQPLRMFNVAYGLAHLSPLSLEIVALSLFGGAAATYTAMRLFNVFPRLQNLVLLGAMALGILLIVAIAHVYTLETVPTWNSRWTLFQFLMTAGVVGPVAAIALLRWQQQEIGEQYTRIISNALAVAGMMVIVIATTGYVGYLYWLGTLPTLTSPFTLLSYGQTLIMARILLMLSGVLTLAVSTIRGGKGPILATVCLVLVLLAEFAGRAFFYDIYIPAGSGM